MSSPARTGAVALSLALSAIVGCPAASLRAQSAASPIRHALYLALGGDPTSGDAYLGAPLAVTAGVERTRAGSRWSIRLGADYRRQSASVLGTRRSEDFGVGVSARYGRASGTIRPYLLGGVGIADLRTRVRGARYYIDPDGQLFPPYSYDNSRWNGSLTTGLGTDFTLGRLRLFTEARLNMYPARLSDAPKPRQMVTTRALYFGVKF